MFFSLLYLFPHIQEWLEDNKGYDAIIDGANVALYQQNFADGGFSLSQVHSLFLILHFGYIMFKFSSDINF